MREDAAWSPILREQGALEELAAIGVEIIRNARNELYLSMRFLDGLKWSVPGGGQQHQGTRNGRNLIII